MVGTIWFWLLTNGLSYKESAIQEKLWIFPYTMHATRGLKINVAITKLLRLNTTNAR